MNQPQQTITTPLGLLCEKPSIMINNYRPPKKRDGSLHVQTLITPRFRARFGREKQRKVEDLMLNDLEHLVRERIPSFYGSYKDVNYVINI